MNKIGEENINTFGSKMVIVGYRKAIDIDVYFSEYNWTAKNVTYQQFKKGLISCPYERRTFGVGYLGEGKYKARENGKITKCYNTWHHMLRRCYDPKFHEKYSTYKDCKVCNKWLNYQNFAEWYHNNYYEIEEGKMHLDKDILNKHNKIYSPENCIFVPERINILFTKSDKSRGDYPIGVSYDKKSKKFIARCNIYDFEENKTKRKYLGCYKTTEKAFESYKQFKEKHVKEVADYYKNLIPDKLYDVLYSYQVEIID